MDSKVCTVCFIKKDFSEFRKSKKGKFGKRANCSECERKRSKEWYIKNKPSPEKTRERNLMNNRGITMNDYNQMFLNQNGKCAICLKHQSELKRRLVVDHCHETETIRGLLCHNCNTALGLLKENNKSILSMLEYIKNKPKTK